VPADAGFARWSSQDQPDLDDAVEAIGKRVFRADAIAAPSVPFGAAIFARRKISMSCKSE